MFLPLIISTAAAVAPLARAYLVNSSDYSSGALGAAPAQTFKTVNWTAAEWNFNVFPSTDLPSGYLLLAPRGSDVETPTGIIYTNDGEVVMYGKEFGIGQTMSFSVGTYQGNQVITTWGGQFYGNGYGNGFGLIYDQNYNLVANISSTISGSGIDFHEFVLTDKDTVLATVYIKEQYNLSSWNVTTEDGTSGWILGGAFEEIDVATGEALFSWKSLDHIDPSECYNDPGSTGVAESSAWDYFHINSIEKDLEGNYLVSSRHCHAVYQISASTGEVLWTINGRNSSFSMGRGTTFEWQHDARWINNYTQISIFDNAASSWESDESMARGLLLNVDTDAMSITLAQEYLPWNETVSPSQGSMQEQTNGNYLLGWGQIPFFSEYSSDGTLLSSAQFGVGSVQGYRVLRSNWTGYPQTTPALTVISNSTTDQYDIYTSWNGATEISSWVLYGATSLSGSASSSKLNQVDKTKFETYFSLSKDTAASYPWVQARAVSSNGTVLGYSYYVSLNGSDSVAPSSTQASATEATSAAATSSTGTATTSSATNNPTSGAENLRAGFALVVAVVGAALLL
ncbi:hypothetical protein CNBJ2300 [Cryptococcus deneoformans B-3501A]|uniref:Arylsulfotransferase n=1 Tax=Cryptococcus deneoformans (strain JEC21 / ATCC MYA-565) TaxID=214684 RepID=Q5KAM6_CRYD1|nr:conserved hypothetical protein [Cryptococcus neoformans var. neoformans JEC21]XP_772954.1 hypothetical protein CNBJ2300 [Cryptococcus neoformans var. neoformans B-3501A]AAW45977.1 conserved hypothetical protein [Cryptococcus neoformans var. neoformans JEC21]EAL18307.1 hypothetical protein CNBJ2300 [Cryptococcus neoformans var. neoformans B-3501A]